MLKKAAAWAAAVIIGLALGVASVWAALSFGGAGAMEQYGLWRHNSLAGSTAADPYTRTVIAIKGLLALSVREARYLDLSRDEEGRPLDESCIYELSSPPLPARWWSVTLYGRDEYLVRNNDNAYSIDASRTLTSANGGWRARISPVRGETANWISSRNAGTGFSLTLRLYNPHQPFDVTAEELPTLAIVSCTGEAS